MSSSLLEMTLELGQTLDRERDELNHPIPEGYRGIGILNSTKGLHVEHTRCVYDGLHGRPPTNFQFKFQQKTFHVTVNTHSIYIERLT